MLPKGPKLGLKTNIKDIDVRDRIEYEPDLVELHLVEGDLFGDGLVQLEKVIKRIQYTGAKVYLHHPMRVHGMYLNVNAKDNIQGDFFKLSTRILVEIAKRYDLKIVVHFSYDNSERGGVELEEPYECDIMLLEETVQNAVIIDKEIGCGRLLWENSDVGVGSYGKDLVFARLVLQSKLRLCIDISHLFLSVKGDNEELQRILNLLEPSIDYFHFVDSMGEEHDGLILGEGKVDIPKIVDMVLSHDYIYEICLRNNRFCNEMIESHKNILEMISD